MSRLAPRPRADTDLQFTAPLGQAVKPVRRIEDISRDFESVELAELAQAKVVMKDRALLERDFPEIRALSDEELDRWILQNAGSVSIPQLQQDLVNTPIRTTDRRIRAWRPPSHKRGTINAVMDPRDPSRQIGLVEVKMNGGKFPPSHAPHSNGIGSLGEAAREFLEENMVRHVLADAGDATRTQGSYFVVDPGFSIRHADGTLEAAGIYGRQVAKRLSYDQDIRSAWLPAELKAPVERTLSRYGIDTGWEVNIQGGRSADGDVALFDFGHYIVRNGKGDPAKAVPFETWGQPAWATQGADEWSLSKQDLPWNYSHDTARAYASGRASRASFTQLHSDLIGSLVRKLQGGREARLGALKALSKNPGLARSFEGRDFADPLNYRHMVLTDAERATLSRQQLEALIGRELDPERASLVEASILRAAQAKSPREKLRILDHAIDQHAGIADLEMRRAYASSLLRRWPEGVDGSRLPPARGPPGLGEASRQELLGMLRTNGREIPAFTRQTDQGEIPVILVNRATYPSLAPLVERSMGDAVKLYPGRGASDHGIFRVGQWNVDYYFPGEGEFGENMRTGIQWRFLPDYVKLRKPGSTRVIEVLYQLTPEEQRVAELYHRARRAAIFRVKHEFKPVNPAYDGVTVILDGGFETCYKFGTGICSIEHSQLMKDQLVKLGVPDPNALLEDPRVKEFLARAEKQLLDAPVDKAPYASDPHLQESVLHDWIFKTPENLKTLRELFPLAARSEMDQVRFMNLLLGIDVSRRYSALTRDLGLFNPTRLAESWPARRFIDESRARATAILVWDESPEAVQRFRDASYDWRGARYGLVNDGRNHPLPR